MSEGQVIIAIDAMGGENSPYKVLKGAEIFLEKEKNTKIIFFGDEVQINENINKYNLKIFNYEVLNTQDVIFDEDSVNTILRSKKNLLALSKFSLPILIAKIFILSNSGLA